MKTTQIFAAAVATLGYSTSVLAQNNNNRQGNNNNNNNAGGNALLLLQDNVQAGSNSQGTPDVAAGQSNSVTDPANFINFCTGKTKTNGKQVTGGSCNGVTMGDIPSNNNMVSSIIIFPGPGEDITANQQFNVQVQLTNLVAGSFTDPINTYYSAPQALQGGNVVGHCHVTIQDLNNDIATKTPPNPKNFAFFKGINDDGNGNGLLQAVVTNGLPAGTYRVCTMNSASNHQPVLMPVAQRGAQDDCTKFTVGQGNAGGNAGGNNNNNNNAGGNNNNNNNAGGNNNNNNAGGNTGNTGGNNGGNAGGNNGGNAAATSTTAAATSTTAAAGGNGGNGGGNGGNGGAAATTTSAAAAATTTAATGRGGGGGGNGRGRRGRFGRGRFTAREYVA